MGTAKKKIKGERKVKRKEFLKEENNKAYSDWFGSGTTHKDFFEVEKEKNKKAINIYLENSIGNILIGYDDEFICIGYDGNEYTFKFSYKK